MTEEENKTQGPEGAHLTPDLGKFRNVEALMRAYRELEAEFTRRSQRLKALEEAQAAAPAQSAETQAPVQAAEAEDAGKPEGENDALLCAVRGNEEVRARIVGEYLSSLGGVPLLAGAGTGVTAPATRASTLKQAGALALGYLKHQKHGG